ncbi:MAG TPA: NADH-quinone oxidoreductase subunit N [Cyclobacteriaceae bacterium]|jgi:NADH-quinone oxidoreductase subunit N|nr:NADH-quinone oxidoreductase subunit N [Cyclobacteriaceae bacterium]HNT50458.1 NADH-quinone oxidoreductase subunit N [Cyclobacteriaceae bacterium]HRE65909.1 NADH-quinone oxidoreductase subunit N [Cyclobacteriaceae bacterium]HRF33753.1 NADH-quinone oxidoreductase subunit N [Cyclobacteriaceae bacterium]
MHESDSITSITTSLGFVVPEVILVVSMCIALLMGLFLKKNKSIALALFTVCVFVVTIGFLLFNWPHKPELLFAGMLRSDDFSAFFRLLFLTGGLFTLFISLQRESATEYVILIQAIVVGACLLSMSMHFASVLVSLELVSLSSYVLAGFAFNKSSSEGSMKYFLLGSVATACLVYGASLIYGLTGTLNFSSQQFADTLMQSQSGLILIAAFLILAAVLFKITAVPFHLWAPDVYQSAPTPVVAFLSVVPKLAGVALFIKIALAFNLFGQAFIDWRIVIAGISVVSIIFGNLSALAQTNPKRMLAYSSIAQAGFLLAGIASLDLAGIHATLYYAAIFLLMNLLTFAALHLFEKWKPLLAMADFAGLGRVAFIPSLALVIGLMALTGLPPTAGFMAKFFVFSALWGAWINSGITLLLVLFIAGLLNTVIALYFYLKIPYYLFLKETPPGTVSIKISITGNLLLIILVVAIIWLFINPGLLMGWINRITFVL